MNCQSGLILAITNTNECDLERRIIKMEQREVLEKELENALDKLRETINKIVTEMFNFEGKAEKEWKMKCPYEHNDMYYLISNRGTVDKCWVNSDIVNEPRWLQGNTFKTREAAELEAKRRNLLTRFRAFRDECNGDWKPNWNDINQDKYVIKLEEKKDFYIALFWTVNEFNLFGYFKNQNGAERAIELFGDEIKALYVDCEV